MPAPDGFQPVTIGQPLHDTGAGIIQPAADTVVFPQLHARTPITDITHHADPQPDPAVELAQARAQAEQQGYQDGLTMARQQAQAVGAAFAQAEALRIEQLHQISRRLEREAVELAFDLVQGLLAHQLDTRPDIVLSVARDALNTVSEAQEIHLLMNPADFELLGEQAERLAPHGSRLHVRPDPSVQAGGVQVTSDAGDVDASRDGRVGRLRHALDELLAEAQDRG